MIESNNNDSISSRDREEVMHSIRARQIVQEILRYGASSNLQILKIIKFLALELEDIEKMRAICKIIDSNELENSEFPGGSGIGEKTNKIEL